MSDFALVLAVFLACSVEAVEATTIVLAAGTARDWRSAFIGVLAGLVALAVIIGVAGPAIQLLPLEALRVVVGGLLLVFGLQWLRKAILRGSGYKALHDEDAIYQAELAEARAAARDGRAGVTDWYAFTLSFKGVLLEGLEVAFIVLTFGTIQHRVGLASLAAAVAIVLVAAAGFAVRKPLARVPENTMKFIVGVMLSSFGIFWGAEGSGAAWPGSDLALLVIIPFVAVLSLVTMVVLRRRRAAAVLATAPFATAPTTASASSAPAATVPAAPAAPTAPASTASTAPSTLTDAPPSTSLGARLGARITALGAFLYDFIVGDDWRISVGIVLAFALTFWLSASGAAAWWLVPAAVVVLLPYGVIRVLRAK